MDHFGLMKRVRRAESNLKFEVGNSKRSRLALWLLASVLISVPAVVFARQNQPAQSAPASNPASSGPADSTTTQSKNPIQVNVQVVNVPVTVLDKRGLPVIDLTKGDFKIFENNKRQTITYFSSDLVPPLRIGLLLDTSNSARMQLKYEQQAADEFVFNMLRGLHSRNRIFLETFDATSSIVQDFTDNPDTLHEKVESLKAGGGKAVYDAIYSACEQKMMTAGPRERTRRVLVLISDGIDVQSHHTLEDAVNMAHRSETAIYAIGDSAYGFSNPGDKYLEKLAEETGGAAFFPQHTTPGTDMVSGYLSHGQFDNLETNKGLGAETGIYTAGRLLALSDSLESLQRELANQYLIGYTPTNPVMDGSYRTIRVVVPHKGMVVRYKPGYFAAPASK